MYAPIGPRTRKLPVVAGSFAFRRQESALIRGESAVQERFFAFTAAVLLVWAWMSVVSVHL